MESSFFISSRGFKYHYQIAANILPATTVFLHGNLASNRWWIPVLEELQKENQSGPNENHFTQGEMILIEMLGCGNSDAPAKPEDMDLLGFAADFNELLREYSKKKKIKTFNLVGHSTGGFVAAAMTALDSALFNKALLVNPPGSNGLILTGVIKAAYDNMRKDKNAMALAIGSTIYKNDYNSDFFKNIILEDAFASIQKISYWIVQAFHNINASDLMKKSTTPTQILFGTEDRMLSISEAKNLSNDLKNAVFTEVPNQGHSMNLESPKAFIKIMKDFLFTKE
jgi:pimeloyl-ACP methyl ester carboxylesterase